MLKTHLMINHLLCGQVVSLGSGSAVIELKTSLEMIADEKKLIHGGFIFGAADYSAMCAVNHPNVVLGSSEVKFIAPVKLGDTVVFNAKIVESKGKKQIVNVSGTVSANIVFEGIFTCFVLEKHVLD